MLHASAVVLVTAIVSLIALSWTMRPVDDLAVRWSSGITTNRAIAAMVVGAAVAFTTGPQVGGVLLLAAYFLARILKTWFEWARGGITGSGLLLSAALFGLLTAGILSTFRGLW